MTDSAQPEYQVPSMRRRFAALFYEVLLLGAVLFLASYLVVWLLPYLPPRVAVAFNQAYLVLMAGLYLVVFWRRGGQTLAMKTWRIRLVGPLGTGVTLRQAWTRYFLALLGTLCFGLTFWWALADRDRQFLHDRLAGTRLVLYRE